MNPTTRSFPLEVRAEGEAGDRHVEGYGATRNRNSYGEVFVQGAFARTVERVSAIKPLVIGWLHEIPIGRWDQVEERDDGLWLGGDISQTGQGNDALTLVNDGAVTGLSIGFYIHAEVYIPAGEGFTYEGQTYQNDKPTFYVLDAEVVETSLVMAPADDEARLVRELDDLLEGRAHQITAEAAAELLPELAEIEAGEEQDALATALAPLPSYRVRSLSAAVEQNPSGVPCTLDGNSGPEPVTREQEPPEMPPTPTAAAETEAREDVPAVEPEAPAEERTRTFSDADLERLAELATVAAAAAHADAAEPAPEQRGYTPPETDAAVTSERELYGPRGERSFFGDLHAARMLGDGQAAERLGRQREITLRDLNSTDTTGGNYVAPIYMQEEFIALARAGRPFANAVGSLPLPPNTDSINLPRMTTGTATAAQSDNGTVQETDAADDLVTIPVRTIAGQQDVSRQVFDRSIPGIDQIMLADLAADYATKLDVQCLNGSGTAPNARGVLNVSGINAVTYTDASPTVAEIYPKIADGVQQVHTGRFLPPTLIVMHPRRWAWFLSATDTAGRPLITPYVPQNAAGLVERVGSENVVGGLHGLPVLVDASVPITLGGGTEDIIVITRVEDLWLFEDGDPQENTYFEVLSSQLGVRLQVHGYFGFGAARYPKAVSTVGGTGLAAPTF